MSSKSAARIFLAVAAGYFLNVILIVATEAIFLRLMPPKTSVLPLTYFVTDVVSQCIIQMLAGYLCRWIAAGRPVALAILIAIGILVGGVSLRYSWNAEPHWYGSVLLVVYAPCIWMGWLARTHLERSA
jgi:hypothetical protein